MTHREGNVVKLFIHTFSIEFHTQIRSILDKH